MCSSSFCFSLLQKPAVEGLMQWFSSTAARKSAGLLSGRSWVQTPPGPSTKVFKKSGEIMLAVKPLSQFRSLGRDVKPLALFSFILVLQLEGDVKEPVTLFEKSRGRRPRRQGLYIWLVPSTVLVGEVWSKRGSRSTPLHADVRSHLSGSSSTSYGIPVLGTWLKHSAVDWPTQNTLTTHPSLADPS